MLVAYLAISLLAMSGPPAAIGQEGLDLNDCLIAAVDEIDLPAKRAGVLTSILVKPGDEVTADQEVIRLHAEEAEHLLQAAKLALQAAEKEAMDDNRVKAARFSAEVSAYEHQQMQEVDQRRERAISPIDLKKAWLQMKHSEIQVLLAERQHLVAELERDRKRVEVQLAESELRDRAILSPRNGMVVQRYKEPGEWVQQGEPILRLIPLDRLRVEGFVSEQEYAPSDLLGATATVTVRFAGNRSVVIENCKIKYVASELEPNGDFRVWTEITNHRLRETGPWLLLPGMTASMHIDVVAGPAQERELRFRED